MWTRVENEISFNLRLSAFIRVLLVREFAF